MAVRQLLGAHKYSLSYRILSYVTITLSVQCYNEWL